MILPASIPADARIDLQLHTTHSDGLWTPEALIDYLIGEQFALAAITDHDRPDTVATVQKLGAERNFHLLAAVEMSSEWNGALTDILCYGFDPADNELIPLAAKYRSDFHSHLQDVLAELKRQGYAFPRQTEVLSATGGVPQQPLDFVELFRQHEIFPPGTPLAPILQQAGFRWMTIDLAEIIEAGHRSGAVCLIAHPGRTDGFTTFDADMLDELRRTIPIDGIEVEYPLHTPEQCEQFRRYAETHDLLMSTGSDSHAPTGQLPIPYRAEQSRRLLERLGISVL